MPDEKLNILEFARFLGIKLYDWQAKPVMMMAKAITEGKERFKVAIRAPNGSGKTSHINVLISLWVLYTYQAGKAVITSASQRQLADQFWPAARLHLLKFPDWHVNNHEMLITTPGGGRLRCFTTNDPGLAEGSHKGQGPDAPLLMIVDETKSLKPDILTAIERCSYTVLLYISSPHTRSGFFYDAFAKPNHGFIGFHAGLNHNPNISPEKISDVYKRFGPSSNLAKSILEGDWMDEEEGDIGPFSRSMLDQWMEQQIGIREGSAAVGIDFAAGGDCNAMVFKDGNQVAEMKQWPDADTARASGKIAQTIREWGYGNRPMTITGDRGGLGAPFIDHIQKYGINIQGVHFGGKSPDPRYGNWVTWAYYWVAGLIADGKIKPPASYAELTNVLLEQLANRRAKVRPSGVLVLESKAELKERGLASPDLADAFVMAFAFVDVKGRDYTHYGNTPPTSGPLGWDYTGDYDDSDRPGRDEGGLGGSFGGVHGNW